MIDDVARAGDIVELLIEANGEIISYEIIRATKVSSWLFGQNKKPTYTLNSNQISTESPLGKSLLGHQVGESIMGYRILKITRGSDHIEHADDIRFLELTKRDAELCQLNEKLLAGEWVRARILSYENRLYPARSLKTLVQPLYTEFRKKLMTEISISNIELDDSGLIQICLSLSLPLSLDRSENALAEMLVSRSTIDVLGLRPCSIGEKYTRYEEYSILDVKADTAFHPPVLEARIDSQTGQFMCRKIGDRTEKYYLRLAEQQML